MTTLNSTAKVLKIAASSTQAQTTNPMFYDMTSGDAQLSNDIEMESEKTIRAS